MDFDDLDEGEANLGPSPDERREELLQNAKPVADAFPAAHGKCFAGCGKMKLLFLHGACSNSKLAMMQATNILSAMENWRDEIEVVVWEGPISVPLTWLGVDDGNNPMIESLKPFGPNYYSYYDHDDKKSLGEYGDVLTQHWQKEDHIGIDETLKKFAKFLKENGPYDGMVGFDMGAHTILRAVTLAQEGDPAFAGMTRFVMLFHCMTTRLLSPIAHVRPKVPLKLPAVIGWCGDDPVQPYVQYEETALFFEEEQRVVVVHDQGHMPPKLASKFAPDLAPRVDDFLKSMRIGKKPAKADNGDYDKLWLPIARVPAPAAPTGAQKRLLVVPDLHSQEDISKIPGGQNPVADIHKLLWSYGLDLAASDFSGASHLSIDEFTYTDEDKANSLLDSPPTNSVYSHDILTSKKLAVAKQMADKFFDGFSVGEDFLGIVGIGSGAIVALMVAKQLISERRYVPGGLWVVNAPTVLPRSLLDTPGMLVDCPVTYLVHELSRVGPPWRWETMTMGPFQQQLFKDKNAIVKLVLDGFSAA